MENENKFTTYLEAAQKLIEENPDFWNEGEQKGVLAFAKYLDSFQTLGAQLEMLAMQQARKIDKELLSEFIDVIGLEKAKEIALKVSNRHRHTSKPIQA